MKRTLPIKCDHFSVMDSSEALAISNSNKCQIVDLEQRVQNQIEVSKPISLLAGSPMLAIGIQGSIYVLVSEGSMRQYLFPSEYESIPPSCIAYSPDKTKVAIGVSNVALVYDLARPIEKALIALLQGHDAPISHLSFLACQGYEHLLITCGSDSRFNVWDLSKRCLCYESPYESSFSIVGVNSFLKSGQFSLAFSDGFVRLYDASPILSEKPSVKLVRAICLTRTELDQSDEEEEESIIISKEKPQKQPKPDPSCETPPEILASGITELAGSELLLCATSSSVVSLNVATFEKKVPFSFDGPIDSIAFHALIIAFRQGNSITVKRLEIGILPSLGAELFPAEEVPQTSPLCIESKPKIGKTAPIATLHRKVVSSGYSQKPPPSRFVKKVHKKKPVEKPPPVITEYNPPSQATSSLRPFDLPTTVASISPSGKRILVSDNSGTVVYLKKSATTYPAFLGHSQPITDLGWSTQDIFVSASMDRTAKLWAIDRPDPILTIDRANKKSSAFSDEVVGSTFLWNDKFILLASGRDIILYNYNIPSSNDVQDMHQAATCKMVCGMQAESGKIVGISASNMPASPEVVAVSSSKTISVFDFYSCQKVLEVDTQHERPIHSVIANFGGIYTPRAEGRSSLALTGGYDETFRLWDLRCARCVRTIVAGSRTKKVGACFSPCSKYLAVGTERQGVEIWDISAGACVSKIKDEMRGTAVTWVQWNPLTGKLYCGLESGVVQVLS